MRSTPTLAVIIPAYNAASLLNRSLDSIASQTVLPAEVIVVDDGSKDNTFACAQAHPIAGLVRFKVLRKENGGQSTARNLGILTATSTHVALLDHDDEFKPTHIENLISAAKLYPNATLLFGAVERVFDSEELAKSEANLPNFRLIAQSHCEPGDPSTFKVLKKTLFQDLIKGNFINPSSSMFPRVLAGKPVLFDESLRYGEDRELFVRLAVAGELVFIDEIGCTIYRTGLNISNTGKSFVHAPYHVKVLSRFIDLFPNESPEKRLVMNLLSARSDDLLYFASHEDFRATVSAIETHRKWTTKTFTLPLYAKRLLYSVVATLRGTSSNR